MSFLFLILSYMTPKEQYKKYFQFMLGISYENKTNMFEAFVTEEK